MFFVGISMEWENCPLAYTVRLFMGGMLRRGRLNHASAWQALYITPGPAIKEQRRPNCIYFSCIGEVLGKTESAILLPPEEKASVLNSF